MGKRKIKIGDKVISKRESDKEGVVIGYNGETREYQIRLSNGTFHYEASRWLEKKGQ